tara:strand:- start:4088 stop:6325 length:2238 start_codon:yes stop_codon:yes gene_type:complete
MKKSAKPKIGGGAKKILYTLRTAGRIGLRQSAKALTSKNTCKACGLGMGGQKGGMTNEQGDFPAVCNKSVQAQSTDAQQPIPSEVFEHSLTEIGELTAHQLEHLGRLNTPLFKAKDSQKFTPVNWAWAIKTAAYHFAKTLPERSFFYASGRSSNEAGFVLQLLARIYGTNNVNNCSYYCHQATGVGLAGTIGVGTATVELSDLDGCDCIFVIGANPASNHPRFIHKLQACRARGGRVIIINPAKEPGLVRFALPKSPKSLIIGGDEIASHYVQPKIGSDIALLKGIAKDVIERGKEADEFINSHTEGYIEFLSDIENTPWTDIEKITGLTRDIIKSIGMVYGESENTVFAWGMGVTHHKHGVENVEYISNIALLRGMIAKRYSGLLPLRGHSNVQGIGTIGVKPVLAKSIIQNIENHLGIDLPSSEDSPGLDTLACIEAAAHGNIDAALIMGGNLYQATPGESWTREAFDKIPLKVFLTTTLNRGHISGLDNSEAIILPVAARDEERQATTQESMFNYVRMSDGGIYRLDNVRSEVDILTNFADLLLDQRAKDGNIERKFDFKVFEKHKNIREAIAAIVPGMEKLKSIDVAKTEFHISRRLIHTPTFLRPSGKARFITSPMSSTDNDKIFPYRLMSVRSEGQFNSIIYEEQDSYRGIDQRWSVMMNTRQISLLGIKEGQLVNIISAHGKMDAVKVYPFDLPDGDLMAYYPEANILTGLDRDVRSKTPAFKSVPVNIQVDPTRYAS